jgi:hypothetical protein
MGGYIDEDLSTPGEVVMGIQEPLHRQSVRRESVSEEIGVWFHRLVAQLLYLTQRMRPESLSAVAYDSLDVKKPYVT